MVQADFVPIEPYITNNLAIAIGQRYNVIITANQNTSNYWLRTWPQSCGRNENDGTGVANAFVTYLGSNPNTLPTSTPFNFTNTCTDESGMVPYMPVNIDSSGFPGNDTSLPISAPTLVNVSGENVFR